MITTLKRFAASATPSKQSEFSRATWKLTSYYVVSTFFILLVSSTLILVLFAPPESRLTFEPEIDEALIAHNEWSLFEFREHLVAVLAITDLLILIVVTIFAYFFAKRTLLPIEAVYERQKKFMSDVAHELRTPLSVMRAGSDVVLSNERSPADYREYIQDVQDETARLANLTNQLLLLLRGENDVNLTKTEIDLAVLARHEIERFKPYATEHAVSLTIETQGSVKLSADKERLVQLLQNLIKNAIDYNKAGGTVTVSVHDNGPEVTLTVSDTGCGIDETAQKHIFERFYKSDSARTHTTQSGAGLGLSIVKEIVTLHQGTIAVHSTPGSGTTITINFPRK